MANLKMQSKVIINVSSIENNPTNHIGFNTLFNKITDVNNNELYCIKGDNNNLNPNTKYKAYYINFPVPNSFNIDDNTPVYNDPNDINHQVIPLLIFLEQAKLLKKQDYHFHICEDFSIMCKGTECAAFIQSKPDLYFRVNKNKKLPDVKNNRFYQSIIDKYNSKAPLYFLPTRLTNNSIVFVVFQNIEDLNDFINTKTSDDYIIALNGFFIPIDEWDCFILFNGDETNGIKSEAQVVNKLDCPPIN